MGVKWMGRGDVGEAVGCAHTRGEGVVFKGRSSAAAGRLNAAFS